MLIDQLCAAEMRSLEKITAKRHALIDPFSATEQISVSNRVSQIDQVTSISQRLESKMATWVQDATALTEAFRFVPHTSFHPRFRLKVVCLRNEVEKRRSHLDEIASEIKEASGLRAELLEELGRAPRLLSFFFKFFF